MYKFFSEFKETIFYPDRNMFDIVGYFTYDNIPPSNVTHVEDFSVSLR